MYIALRNAICAALVAVACRHGWSQQPVEIPPVQNGSSLQRPGELSSIAVPNPWSADPAVTDSGPAPSAILASDLTLDELRQLALESNPTLAQARMAVQAAVGQQIQAGVYLNPQLAYSGADMGLEGTSGQQGLYVGQEFITAHKRRLATNVAGHRVAAAEQTFEAQRWRILNDVRWGFYDVLIAQEMVDVNEDLVNVGNTAVETTARLREFQEVSEADVLQAKIEYERAKLSLFQARNRHRAAWYQLTAVVGQPALSPRSLQGDTLRDLPDVTWENGLTRLLALSPEMGQALAQLEQAKCNVALQNARRYANFSIQGGVKYDESTYDTLADVTVGMPLMIFDRNQGNVFAARAALAAAQREVERVELSLRNRYARMFEGYSNARQQAIVIRASILDNARQSLELTAAGYRAGEYGYLQLLTAQRTYFSVNLEYLSSLQQLWSAAVQLDGYLLTGGLASLN